VRTLKVSVVSSGRPVSQGSPAERKFEEKVFDDYGGVPLVVETEPKEVRKKEEDEMSSEEVSDKQSVRSY
jgi:hypothetical protein